MPYINRFKRKPKEYKKYHNSNKRKRNRTDKEKLRVKLYNKKAWKRLRLGYLMYHPLCEMCLQELDENGVGRVTQATDVHHVLSPFDDGLTDEERIGRLLNPNNLQSLCQYHHGLTHYQQQQNEYGNKDKNKK